MQERNQEELKSEEVINREILEYNIKRLCEILFQGYVNFKNKKEGGEDE